MKARTCFFFITCSLLSVFTARASGNETDSLRQLLGSAANDTSRVLLHIEIAKSIGWNSPDSMMVHALHARQLSEKMNYPKGLFLSYLTLSSARYVTGEYGKGLSEAKQALKIAHDNNNKEWEGSAAGTIGLLYHQTGKYADAAGYFEEVIKIAEKHGR